MSKLHPRAIDATGLADGKYVFDVVNGKVTAIVAETARTWATIVYIPSGGTAADVPPGTPNDALIIERG